MEIKRGDIFFADLSPVLGSEMGGMRYVVVIQNDELNDEASSNGNTVIVAPLSDPSLSSCMYLVLAEGQKECVSWDLFGELENYIWKGKK